MRLRITEDARKYVHAKGYDSITIESMPRRSCCTVDYTSKVKLGRPRKNYGYEKQRTLDIDTYISGFITGLESHWDLTVKLVDMKLRKLLVLDKNE